jgi:hypothetical protein
MAHKILYIASGMPSAFFLILALITLSISANAANYYIAVDGSDSNAGTLSAPFATLGKAQSLVQGGDHCIYENLSMHDGMAIGFYITKGSNNLVLNCDAYNKRIDNYYLLKI